MVDDETFFAWLDGELPPEEAARVQAEVATDPRLSRLADEHRAMAVDLRNAFAEVEARPLPGRLERAFDRDDKIAGLAEARAVRAATRRW